MLPLLSLFCGPGGMDEGFKKAGFTTLLAVDVDPQSVDTYKKNHFEARAEILDLLLPNVEYDINRIWKIVSPRAPLGIIGGPPCQTFSVSSTYNGLQKALDPRNMLPESYGKILKLINNQHGIDFFVLENVLGLKSKKYNHKFDRFKEIFQLAGFKIFEDTLNAINFGVPQYRNRIFVVGINAKKYPNIVFNFPTGNTIKETVRDIIEDLPEPIYFDRVIRKSTSLFHPNHWTMNPLSQKWSNGELYRDNKGRSFRRLQWDEPSPTLAFGNREVNPHPNGKRRISVLEAMLLQGFSKDYQLYGTMSAQYRMISEVVSPPVAQALAEAIITQLGYH